MGYEGKNMIANIVLTNVANLNSKSKKAILEIPRWMFKSIILENMNNNDTTDIIIITKFSLCLIEKRNLLNPILPVLIIYSMINLFLNRYYICSYTSVNNPAILPLDYI